MSKRKNPLQNLDDFLKQEATSFVTPKKLSEPKPVSPAEKAPESIIAEQKPSTVIPADITKERVMELAQKLANKNNKTLKQQLLDLLKEHLEETGLESSKNKMLINTLIYLENGDNWKEKVEEYWASHTG